MAAKRPAKKRAPAKKTTTRKRSTAKKRAPAKRKAAPKKRKAAPKPPVAPPGEQIFLLDVDFEVRQAASYAGARWDPALRSFIYIGTTLPEALRQYSPTTYSWSDWQQHDLNKTAPTRAPQPDKSTGKFTLRSDQETDVQMVLDARAAGAPEFLIGNTTGLGKTAVAIAAIKRMPKVLNVLIICPLPVASNWQAHLRDMSDGGMRWCTMNYESTKKLVSVPAAALNAKAQRTKNKAIAKDGKSLVKWDVVITDESHKLANPDSIQSQTIENLISGTSGAAFALRLSATAGANPAELGYLHRMFAWQEGTPIQDKISASQYEAWCAKKGMTVIPAPFGNGLAWDGKQSELDKMSKILFGGTPPCGVRRERADWPDQERHLCPVKLSGEQEKAYQTEWAEFQDAMKMAEAADRQIKLDRDQKVDDLERRRRAAKTRATQAKLRKEADRVTKNASKAAATNRMNSLAAMTRYRQKAGQLRAPGTAKQVADLVINGKQVAVACEYIGTVDRVAEELVKLGISPAMFTGQNRPTRETERIAYQRGDKKVILFTPVEGFNLHAGDSAVGGNDVPRVTVVAEPRWSPKKALQVEGRSQRDGTAAPVYYLYATGTIEDKVIRKVVDGMKNVTTINGADTKPFKGLAQVLGVSTMALAA